jgi:CheY-like chemotaxis protein
MDYSSVANSLGLQGMRVLIVEDAPAVGKALQSLLEDFGMVVVGPVATPGAAERVLAEQSPDLALVDMHLSGHTGYALADRMRRAGMPLVVISGSAELPAEEPCLATLQKPFSGQELLRALHQVVRARSIRS